MHIALLDPGLNDCAGHHLDLDRKIVGELKSRGHRVSVFAHGKIDAQAVALLDGADSVTPLFRTSPYRNPALIEPNLINATFDPLSGGLAHFIDGAAIIAQDLKAVRDFDLWLWPSFYASHLLACADSSPSARISACIHVEPSFESAMGQSFWRYAFTRALAVNLQLRAGVHTPELAAAYSTLCPELPTQLWPIFVDGIAAPHGRNQMHTIGFFGQQKRHEKGYNLISPLVTKLLEYGYQVVVQDSGCSFQPSDHDRLEILGRVEDIGQHIRGCDLIAVPYHPEAYRFKGSGIVWEAIANGVPVVVPEKSSLGNLIATLGCGRQFGEFSTEAVLTAIRMVHAEYSVIGTLAQAAAQRWAGVHGIRRFVDCLISGAHC